MANELYTDPNTLQALAQRLRSAGESLDSCGGEAPDAPDAGPLSGDLAAVIAHLAGGAGQLVVGLHAASEAVRQSREEYLNSDQAAGQRLGGI